MSDLPAKNDDVSLESVESGLPEELLTEVSEEEQSEAEQFAIKFLQEVLRLRGVSVDRAQFLKAELHKRGCSPADIEQAIAGTPVQAGVSIALLDEIAQDSIGFETKKSSAMSFAAGLPGGFALIGTVPADITQFYIHAFRVMQKVAYVYGWQSLLDDSKDVDDETLAKLASLLGVMMGVGSASRAVVGFAANVAGPAVQKHIAKTALTKTSWYVPMKQVLRIVGVQVTKQSFAKTAAKVVPIVGGFLSGGMTWVTLDTQSRRLMDHLREIPPPNVDAEKYLAELKVLDEAAGPEDDSLTERAGAVFSGVADHFRSVDLDGDGIPDEPQAMTAAKDAASALKGGALRAASFFRGLREDKDDDSAEDLTEAPPSDDDAPQ